MHPLTPDQLLGVLGGTAGTNQPQPSPETASRLEELRKKLDLYHRDEIL